MICKDCQTKPIARGIKTVICFKCDRKTIVNCFHTNTCNECSDEFQICQYCGKQVVRVQDPLLRGDFNKFIVLGVKDVKNISVEHRINLEHAYNEVSMKRFLRGVTPEPKYLVINTDEPYAQEVIAIMKRNNHWG